MSEKNHQMGFSREDSLEQAIERLNAGESLEMIMVSAGADAEWLKPMLSVAAGVRDLSETVAVPPAETSLATFLAAAGGMAPAGPPSPPWWERLTDGLRLPAGGFLHMAATAAWVALMAVLLTLGSAFFLGTNSAAAQGVLPGQPLYPVKRLGEEIVLRLPQSGDSRQARATEYEERRRDEAHWLLGHNLEAEVSFRGQVEELADDQVVVNGIRLTISDDTQIDVPLTIGDRVRVEARSVRNGGLIAQQIVVEVAAPTPTSSPTGTPSPTPSLTATPTATDTPTSTPTATLTATSTQEPTSTPEPTATPTEKTTDTLVPPPTDTPEPTDTPTPIPTPTQETPEGPDNGNVNDNVNGNDGNGNDNDNDNDVSNDNDSASNDNGGSDDSGGGNESQEPDSGNDNSDDSGSNDNDSGNADSASDDHSGKGGGDDNSNDNSN